MTIDILGKLDDIDEFANLFIRSLPDGYLYNENLKPFVKGFLTSYQDYLRVLNTSINDIFDITADNYFLEEFKREYGLPNALFPVINTNEEAALAVTMMKKSKYLNSKEDFENFLLLLGYNVEFFLMNDYAKTHLGFNYSFPVAFSNSITGKDKLTYWVYVEDSATISFRNIGFAFPIQFSNSGNNTNKVKKILDFIKPDYLIFRYINSTTKTLYGL
jgi:hypothetical protein